MLIEDGNGQSIIVASFLALNETEATFSKMAALFIKHNPQWESVTVIMADKDLTERTVLAEQFPSAQLLICLFHTLQSFRREITLEKMGITAGKRIYCLRYCNKWHTQKTQMNIWSCTVISEKCTKYSF